MNGLRGSRRRPLVIALGLLTAIVALVGVGPAQASSIFFLRNNNIWVSNPDGSGAQPVTTDGTAATPYDFVSSAKQGSAPALAFHRGGNSASQFGTVNPDGSGEAVNPYNSSMQVDNHFDTRLDNAGDRVTWAGKCSCSSLDYFADSVATSGSSPQSIYNLGTMDAMDVTFGDPAGDSLLFTDVGHNYKLGDGNNPCNGTDDSSDVLVLETPAPSGSNSGPPPSAIYCDQNTFFFDPALRPDGQLIAAESESNLVNSSTQIVTIPIGNGVSTTSDQTAVNQITAPNSGDTLPDFSPDGTEIVFQGPNSTIDTVPTGGGSPTPILTNATVPAWSPYTLAAGGGGGGTGSSKVGHARVTGTTAGVAVSCAGSAGETCKDTLTLTVAETVKGGKIIAIAAATTKRTRAHRKLVSLATAKVTLAAGHSESVRISLDSAGRRLLATRHRLAVKLTVSQSGKVVSATTINFKATHRH